MPITRVSIENFPISYKATTEMLHFDAQNFGGSYSGYQSHAPFDDFFPFLTKFWWMSIKCIHDNGRVHFVSVTRRCSIIVGSGIIAQLL